MSLRTIIVSGGTGGHVYPGIAIAEEIQARDIESQILFIGSEAGLEKDLVPKERFSIKLISSVGIQRKFSLKLFKVPFLVIKSIIQAFSIIRQFQPNVVISTGGYASFPVVIAAKILRIPVVLHEQNAIPGLTNRLCKYFAKRVTLSYFESFKYFNRKKTEVIGNPVRKKVINAVRSVSRQKLNIDQGRKTLLVVGGSQGARKLNEIVAKMVDSFASDGIQVIHVVGNRDYDWVLNKTENVVLNIEKEVPLVRGKTRQISITKYKLYHPYSFMYNIWDGLAAADLVVSRAGGTAIAEILARGIPSILIPYPYAADNHQKSNAQVLENAGASIVISDKELSEDKLMGAIKHLFSDREKLAGMSKAGLSISKPDAASKMIDTICQMLGITLEKKRKKKMQKRRKKALQNAA